MQTFYSLLMIFLKQVLFKINKDMKNENFRFYIKPQSKLGRQKIEIFNDLKDTTMTKHRYILQLLVGSYSLKMVGNQSKMTSVQVAKLQGLPKTKLKLFV